MGPASAGFFPVAHVLGQRKGPPVQQIKFKATGWCSSVGNFSDGTLARVGDAMAHHLVAEVCVADYVQPKPQPESQFVDTIPVEPPAPPEVPEIIPDPVPAKRRAKP